ncbi:hypothetical protein OJF2_49820 [Aquisphaera giovannonii]|uniref:Uncharacterized protein n=1 Tax=Aquisphaera giovannonii TaxID=406548 RepID=A0A5B9W764_9BACT|nr:hypothetical protein [Aquisphaera giovannonii]QEH36418.1 hypothetical protein OJF2_49820 [Aquisphaera giovannonii]
MQILTYNKATATAGNTTYYKQNNIDYRTARGPNFNGNLVDGGNWNYWYSYNGGQDVNSTVVPASGSIPATGVSAPTTSDAPESNLPNVINGKPVTAASISSNFSMYLMFKSLVQGSVWLAVSQLNWSWSVSVSQQGGAWPNPNPKQQTAPGNSTTPAGAGAFPPWVNTTAAYRDYYAPAPTNWRT